MKIQFCSALFLTIRPTQKIMSSLKALFLLALVVACVSADQILEKEARGTAVTKAAVAKVLSCNIFPSDNGLLRKIGWVESEDGNHRDTYRNGYNGGIWQVDYIGFFDTQTHPTAVNKLHAKINACLGGGVNWATLPWSELRKPLYSAIAARAKLYITGRPTMCLQAIPTSNQDQANHWKQCYNSAMGAGTVEKFLSRVAVMPN